MLAVQDALLSQVWFSIFKTVSSVFLGLEDSHDTSKSTPWARKIKRQDDRLKFTVARAHAHFRFVVSVLFAIFGSVFVQFCVSGLASCLRFVSVLLPFRCCIVSVARKRCVNFFLAATVCLCTCRDRLFHGSSLRYLGSRRLFSRCCFARVRRVNGGQRKGFLFPSIHSRSLQYTSTET